MRLAISNIAWDVAEDEFVARLLKDYGIDAIDVAPGKYFSNPTLASAEEMQRVRTWWSDRGIEITGMQALLFGTSGLNVFGSLHIQEAMLAHLAGVCRVGAGMGALRLVFGSPKNRDRGGLIDEDAMAAAVPFFRRLGDIALSYGVVICLEPNPPCYGANFMTNSAATARVVECVAHDAIRMQFDTGAVTINNEDAEEVLGKYGHLIGHTHASEPDLLPLGDGKTNHGKMHTALSRFLPEQIVTIEMLATKSEPHVVSIERALRVATSNYRGQGE
jgi:sugar phosphate isomerase/epimerase